MDSGYSWFSESPDAGFGLARYLDFALSAEALKQVADFDFLLLRVEQIGKFSLEQSLKIRPLAFLEGFQVIEDQVAEVAVIEDTVTNVFGFGVGGGGDIGGDVKLGFAAFNQAAMPEVENQIVVGRAAFLDGVERQNVGPGQISVREQGAAVIFINEPALDAELDMA